MTTLIGLRDYPIADTDYDNIISFHELLILFKDLFNPNILFFYTDLNLYY